MNRLRTGIIVGLLMLIGAGSIALVLRVNWESYSVEITLPPSSGEIEVHISGEVCNPGVYVLSEGAIVVDGIEAAGGMTAEADKASVNLAMNLRDGAQIHIFRKGESSQRININTADVWLLDALDGIGPALAQRIVEYRSEIGPFETPDDLKKVEGIGEASFEKIRDKITVH